MSEQSRRLLRGSARATTGIVIMAVAVLTGFSLGSGLLPVPAIERGTVSVEVDISQNAKVSLVCTGAFGELGADPSKPGESLPSGVTDLAIAGRVLDQGELQRTQPEGSAPRVFEGSANGLLAAAEVQRVATPTLQGLVASSCAEPSHEQWLVGGGTALGQSTTVVLGNPFEVPATVQLAVFDENGRLDDSQTAGVLVPAGSQRIVSLNGYAPARDRLAVRVDSTGAAVTAALGVSHTVDIRSYAVDTVTRQLTPSTRLVVAGVVNFSDHQHAAPGTEHGADDFPVVVRVLAPGGEAGSARILTLLPDGTGESLGTIDFDGAAVADFEVAHWPEEAQAVVIDADAPVVGGVFATGDLAPAHDYAWFAPAPMLAADSEVAAAIVPGGELVLVNPGGTEATVTIRPESLGSRVSEVVVPAGAALVVEDAQGAVTLKSTAPIAAGVRVVDGAYVAGYPVLAPLERILNLSVYTR